ncbi:MAG TPA: tripartite tricarboxylate transporter substrate binding protein [Burkholderiales bacterium]|nr:tripartite tricarboxylate transporter substrate binding protein [Burkholderiales bacterium]
MPTVNAIGLCALVMMLPAGSAHAASASYPVRPVRVIVPYAAGGSSDLIARLLGPRLSERLGQQFVVDNRAGGGTLIGTDIAAHAPADGHTLLVATPPLVVNPVLYARVDYVADRDFAGVCNMAASSNLLVVHPALSVTTVKDLIALARAQPDHYTYGSSGIGGAAHLAMALFAHEAGIALVHVPYKGGSLAVADLIAGRVNLAMANLTTALPHLRSGRLRGLAIGTGKRSALLPDMPTVSEAGVPGYEANNWNGIVVPRATPRAVVRTLHSAIAAALREPAMAERVSSAGLDVIADTPEEFSAYLRSEAGKWGKLIKTAGIKAE